MEESANRIIKGQGLIPNKSYLFNEIPTFLVETKNFSQNFVITFDKMCFWPGSGQKFQDPDPQKKQIRISNTAKESIYKIPCDSLFHMAHAVRCVQAMAEMGNEVSSTEGGKERRPWY